MLSSFFSSKNALGADNKAVNTGGVFSLVKDFAKKASVILGLATASNVGVNVPEVPPLPTVSQTRPTPIPAPKPASVVTEPVLPPKIAPLVSAVARPGISVNAFKKAHWGTTEGYLINKRTGKRVIDDRTDLIAGETYVLAKTESEATTMANLYARAHLVTKKPIATVTKPDLPNTPIQAKSEPVKTEAKTPEKVTTNIPKTGFDFSAYVKAISWKESKGNHKADNSHLGVALKVPSAKSAVGENQFTRETLALFNIKTEKQLNNYLNSPTLQMDIMKRYTLAHLQMIMKSPVLAKLQSSGVQIHEILASMHHMGAGGVQKVARYAIEAADPRTAYFQKLDHSKDWLGKKTSHYVKEVSLAYQNMVGSSKHVPEEILTPQAGIVATPEKIELPKTRVSTVASNDEQFTASSVQVASIEKASVPEQSSTIELVDVLSGVQSITPTEEEKTISEPLVIATEKVASNDAKFEQPKENTPVVASNEEKFEHIVRNAPLSKLKTKKVEVKKKIEQYSAVGTTEQRNIELPKLKKVLNVINVEINRRAANDPAFQVFRRA